MSGEVPVRRFPNRRKGSNYSRRILSNRRTLSVISPNGPTEGGGEGGREREMGRGEVERETDRQTETHTERTVGWIIFTILQLLY